MSGEPVIWSWHDRSVAMLEGWDVFDNSDHGVQIERIDDMAEATGIEGAVPLFETDDDARRFVQEAADVGHELHRRALAYVEQERANAAR